MMREKTFLSDWWLLVLVCLFVIFGLVMVYDASYPIALAQDKFNHDALFFFRKQLVSAMIGLGAFYIFSKIPYWHLKKFAKAGFCGSVALLAVVWIIGKVALGAKRWINLGLFGVQPSELAKLALVLFIAAVFAGRPERAKNPMSLLAISLLVAVPIGLTERQPDMGTAAVMLLTFFVMLMIVGVRLKHMLTILAVSLLVGTVAILVKPSKTAKSGAVVGGQNYRVQRLTSFLHPEANKEKDGYQNWRAFVALGVGGWHGVGFTKSSEKRFGAMPERQTDFIFAVIGEELGLAGTLAVVLAYLALGLRGMHIAIHTRDPFGRLLATGITTSIMVQALLNLGVVTSSIPNTGIPLPMISYGGSSLVTTLASLGILLGISRYPFHRNGIVPQNKDTERPGMAALRQAGIV